MVPLHAVAAVSNGALGQLQFPPTGLEGVPTTGAELLAGGVVGAIVSMVVLGILGAIVIAIAPDFADEGAAYVRTDPAEAFVYGFGAYIVGAIATFLLAITVIGLIVVIPAVIALAIIGIATTTVAIVAVGSWVGEAFDLGTRSELWGSFAIGVVVWSLLRVVPILGGLVTFVLGAMGFGYFVARLVDERSGTGSKLGDVHGLAALDRDARGSAADRSGGSTATETRGGRDDGDDRDDRADRFRNLAAADQDAADQDAAERNADDESESSPDDADSTADPTDDDRYDPRDR